MTFLPIIALATVLCVTTAQADDAGPAFAAGAQAYDGGRYGEAFAVWLALAERGETRAQVAIAGMHRFGEGRTVNLRAAARWYRLAAEGGDPIAQLNYAEMLAKGEGVVRDRKAAWHWFDRAARQGNAWAAEQRDVLGIRPD